MHDHRSAATKVAVVAALAAAYASARLPLHGQPAPPSSASFQPASALSARATFQSSDLYRLKSVGDVQMSPDGRRIAYSVQNNDRPGRPYSQVSSLDDARLAWSPDGRQVAFISATPGPETENANGDPMVITRYLYKPTASEGLTRFNDNRRLHVFVVDIASRQVRQLTRGDYYEHSIEWSPEGGEILFVSNREPDPDRVFNYDVFAAHAASGDVRRLTDTPNAEYRPIWSPNGKMVAYLGTRRSLTSSETTMEDTHVWVMD